MLKPIQMSKQYKNKKVNNIAYKWNINAFPKLIKKDSIKQLVSLSS